jgi:hypothetical protein
MREKIIHVPDLNARNALDFCNLPTEFDGYDGVTYDYGYMSNFDPFGMLLVGSKMREHVRMNSHLTFSDANYKNHTYAGHMGFFQSVNQDFGNMPGEARGNSRYIPVTCIKIRDLRIESYDNSEVVQKTIDRRSLELARVLCQENHRLASILSYSIRELMRNIVEHSDSDTIWFAAQKWDSKGVVEIAILDEGVGINQAISFNPNLKIKHDEDALLLAIEPGISGKAFIHNGKMRPQSGSDWDNSGYGLFVTSEISQLGGDFILCSGNKAIQIKDNRHVSRDTEFNGTAIRMRLNLSEISGFGEELIRDIVANGESRARENAITSVVSASRVSRVLNYND